ncbi:E3 ubiquitin-protein ligase RBBP6-like isoform X3 [Micropterus salmoides]|uniref:E3 ubiquitin-protein ligase RBBP6-like isoform X3 n=1 Tax=Micropterus salmoides TaxID=27706 RepID=UPI0018EB0A78|nr:E3 ubiquitin-protein ligase RBBP6-like isoform X3 [Micropterus salmoides]
MTHVHYKFSSKLSYDTVVFDGPHITLRDLKRQIMGREKLRAGDCDLQITNAQTKEEYTDDEGLIPKGSSVIVRRIPIIGGKSGSSSKIRNIERSDVHLHHALGAVKAMDDQRSSRVMPFFSKMANLADADVSEEDKIRVMINQSTYDSMNYNKKFGTVLPANYTCYRCGNTGHHIRNCPTSGQDKNFEAPLRIKKSTGIPRSFMVEVDDPSIKGAMLTNCGRYAIPAIDAQAYAIGKKEKPPFIPQDQPKSEGEEDPVPEELLCVICHDLLSDAVVIPCCGNSYCDDCIRTALLDSEEHICPTCSQSDVSPDTLSANKFLRQAVNTFKKERGFTKSLVKGCGISQSQNPAPTPSPVPTPPPLTMQSQPQKPYQSTHSQQDPLLPFSQAADTPTSSQVFGAPPTATGPPSASSTPSPSLEPVQSHLEISDKEAAEETHDDSAAAAPSVLVLHKDPAAAPSQQIPLVNLTPVVEQPQTVSVNLQQSSSASAPRHCGPSPCWESSSSSSSCPTGGWNESNTQQRPPSSSSSSSYPATPPPLFPSPHFHTFLAAQQPLNSYPPGYPPTTPVWTLPTPQGAPIPSLCSSTSIAPIPALIPKEWYSHQRKKKERSPHGGSTYRRFSSRSHSKSSKSKSSSSRSRSRSRSRSQGRSRPQSPYSRHRDLHTRSLSSRSYSYGYKRSRSPTPSSSSSPRVGYSRSKSASGHRKNSQHSRHSNKKPASSSYSSRRRGERSQREAGGSGGGLASCLNAQHANQTSSLELDRERYLQWKREYKEWCEKYFSSYVGLFHQLPPPLLNLHPSPHPQWGCREGSINHSHTNSESLSRQVRRTARMGVPSPPSQSSSDSRSPPSHSSSDSHSTPSQSSSDSRSSPPHSSNDSRSPPSQSSSDGRSTSFEDRAQLMAHQQRCAEKYSRLPITLTKDSKEVELQERSKDNKQLITRNLEKLSTLKHEQKSIKKHEEEGGKNSSSPDAADSIDDTGPNACKDGTLEQDKANASLALESIQPLVKPDKRFDQVYERKSREQRNLGIEKGWRRGQHSESRQDEQRPHKEKHSKGGDRVDSDRYRNPGGSKASDSRSEKNRKRKGEDMQRSPVKAQSSKCLKSKIAEHTETHKSEPPNPFDRKKPKTEKRERKTWPLTDRDIWEGEIKVKPQKKISININLDGKRQEEKTEKQDLSNLESITVKTTGEIEKTCYRQEEKSNGGETKIEVNEKNESRRDQEGVTEDNIKPDVGKIRQKWEKATFRDGKGEAWGKIPEEKKDVREKKEDIKEEDFDLRHCAFRGVEEEKVSKKQWKEGVRMEGSKGEEVTNEEGEMGELVTGTQKKRAERESTCTENRGNPPGESKPKEELMDGVKWRMKKEENTVKSKSQRSRNDSYHVRPNPTVDDGSYESHQEWKTVVALEEYNQDRAVEKEDQHLLIEVPRSKWENEESEGEEQDESKIQVQADALAVFMPSPSVSVTAETPTDRETEEENEQKRQRSVEIEGERARAMENARDSEGEKNNILSSSHRSEAPSSGKDRTDRGREKVVEMERPRHRDRGRESERPRDRQKKSKRSKGRTREEEKGRERERDGQHGNIASIQNRNPSSSVQSCASSVSHDTDRRDRGREGDHNSIMTSSSPGGKFSSGRSWESSTISRAIELPDKNAHKTYKDHPHFYHNQQDPSGSFRHKDRPVGTDHSPPSLPHSRGKERIPLPCKPSGGSELGKRSKVDKVYKGGKGARENQEMVAQREGGGPCEGKADQLDGQTKWEGARELEEGERPSSRSNSASSSKSQESGRDDRRKETKKRHKKHKKETRQPSLELLEEGELKKHKHKKKSKKSRDGGEEESSGEVDGAGKKDEDHAKLCSLMLY